MTYIGIIPFYYKTLNDNSKNIDKIKMNMSQFLLNKNKTFYSTRFKENTDIYELILNTFGIEKSNINKLYKLTKKKYIIYIPHLNINNNIKNKFVWDTKFDFFKIDKSSCYNDLYENILNETDMINTHINIYIKPSNNKKRKIIKILDIYNKLQGKHFL